MINAGYGRVSSDEQADIQNAARNQRSRLEREGCGEIFFDVLQGTNDDRPDYLRLVERIKKKTVDRVTVTKLDRLTRGSTTTLDILELFLSSGVELCILERGGVVDLKNIYVWKELAREGIDNHFYVKLLSINCRRGYEELRLQRKANPSCPFGFKRVNEQYAWDEAEIDIARSLIALYEECEGRTVIFQKKILEMHGATWSRLRINNWLKNPVLRGHTPRGTKRYRELPHQIEWDTHPDLAILTEEQYQRIEHWRDCNRRLGGRTNGGTRDELHPISGLCRCARCGAGMQICRGGGTRPGTDYRKRKKVLRCVTHNANKILCDMRHTASANQVEEAVISQLIQTHVAIIAAEKSSIELIVSEPHELKELRVKLKRLNDMALFDPDIETAKTSIQRRIEVFEQNMNNTTGKTILSRKILAEDCWGDREYWTSMSPDDRRQLYRKLVEKITIDGKPNDRGKKRGATLLIDYQIVVTLVPDLLPPA